MKLQSVKSTSGDGLLSSHENFGQNGCKPKNVSVFASVSRFGETKFKPIRKQENVSLQQKPNVTAKRARIDAASPSPVKRVNKFFKSRNGPTTQPVEEPTKSRVSPSKRRLQSTELKSITTKIGTSKVVEKQATKSSKNNDWQDDEEDNKSLDHFDSQYFTNVFRPSSTPSGRTSIRISNVQNHTSMSSPTCRRTRNSRHVSFESSSENVEKSAKLSYNRKKREEDDGDQDYTPMEVDRKPTPEPHVEKRYSTRYSKNRNSDNSDKKQEPVLEPLPPPQPPDVKNMFSIEDITLKEEEHDTHLLKESLDDIDELDPFRTSPSSDAFTKNNHNEFGGRDQERTDSSHKAEKMTTRYRGKKRVPIKIKNSLEEVPSSPKSTMKVDPIKKIEPKATSGGKVAKTILKEFDTLFETDPIDDIANDPIDEPIDDPVDEPINELIDEPSDGPFDEPIDGPINEHNDYPVDEDIGNKVKESTNNKINELILEDILEATLPKTVEDSDEKLVEGPDDSTIASSKMENVPSTSETPASDTPTKTGPAPVPQKKRFFSRSNKDKKQTVQFNTKNFFTNRDDPDLEDEFNKEEQVQETKKENDPAKDYDYLKLKKVRKAHQCAELGETEHFDGEIKFYLSGIKERSKISMRCLSVLGLANQCLNKPELRMHLRAHDYMSTIISALMDSPKNPNLALCTAALMFIYNQDRLTMDIDPNALSLMLELLECSADDSSDQIIEVRHKETITNMCKTMKEKGYGKYLKLNEITAGTLSLETLLGLTSKRAGDWFKEELRTLNGIDFLLNTVLTVTDSSTHDYMQEEGQLNKIDRSLRVIENVTCMNTENQRYVIQYKDHSFIQRCSRLFEQCRDLIIYSETSAQSGSFLSPLLSILRVFTNLTSDSCEGCKEIGSNLPEIFKLFLNSVFELPSFIVPDSRFDLIIFLLCLCVNLVEFCEPIRNEFIENQSQIRRLISMLVDRVEEAQKTEKQADDFLDSHEAQRQLNAQTINIDSILTDLLAKSGKHMEHTIIAACISLLIGCGIKENYEAIQEIKKMLPNQSFDMMIDVITKLKEFSNLAVSEI